MIEETSYFALSTQIYMNVSLGRIALQNVSVDH